MGKRLLLLVSVMMVIGLSAFAQVTTSSIGGHIYDDKNQPLTGAVIKAVHTPTGTAYYSASLNTGRFAIGGMRVGGPYVIEVEYLGYKTEKRSNITLTLGEEATFNFAMKEESTTIGDIVITGSNNPVFSSNRTGSQEVITQEMMSRLPAVSRSLSDYTKLAPMSNNGNFGGLSYRYNNVTVDGASFNNSFGLSPKLGASSSSASIEPISIESIEQIQVMLSPFDVRNGGFTGGSINSVTKSGSNKWSASAYTSFHNNSMQGWEQRDSKLEKKYSLKNQYGVSLSGPIIQNKLFFFINGEIDRQSEFNSDYRADRGAATNGKPSKVQASVLDDLKEFLTKTSGLNYNPGTYDVGNIPTEGNRLTARLDWNVSRNNTLSLKYYYLKSFTTNPASSSGATGSRGPNADAIPFSSVYFRQNNNFNILMAELNTKISDRSQNVLTVGYSAIRDFRDLMYGDFYPQVDILWADDNTKTMTTFGTEANSYNNMLNSDIWQIKDHLTIISGKHQFTFGAEADLRKFKNGYANSYTGSWKFKSLDSFKYNTLAMKKYMQTPNASFNGFVPYVLANPTQFTPETFGLPNGTPLLPSSYQERYAIGNSFPYAFVNVMQLSAFFQDKWSIMPNLNLTYGLRADIPIFLDKLDRNRALEQVKLQNDERIDVSKLPDTRIQFSPRVGFNWDVMDDKRLQLRGGMGLFSGTPPYVWISNQAGNNGLLFGDVNTTNAGFSGLINYSKPAAGSPTVSDISVTDEHFKYPTVFKGSIAADYDVYDGWIFTAEFLYSRNMNDIYHRNIGLSNPVVDGKYAYVADGSGTQTRPYYGLGTRKPYISDQANGVVVLSNSNKGYSAYTSFKLQKNFYTGALKGLYLNASYTFGQTKAVSDGSSSQAISAWRYRQALDPNYDELGYTSGSFPNRFLGMVSYRKEYAKHFASSIGLIYDNYMPQRFSYTYAGDINGDGRSENDLIFIPTKAQISEMEFVGTNDEQAAKRERLDKFISQDDYLSSRRGKYAERNGGVYPSLDRVDLNFTQDFFVTTKKGDRNTLRFTIDISNFGNLLNKNWGIQKITTLGSMLNPQYQFISISSVTKNGNVFTPKYDLAPKMTDNTFEDYSDKVSRWYMVVGIKYMFN